MLKSTISDDELRNKIKRIRIDIANMFHRASSGHFGGSFSVAEIVGTLYFRFLRVDSNNPKWEDRDRFIISKGHGAPAVFSVLHQLGFFPAQYLEEYETLGANLNTHPNMLKVPGIDLSTGSLGHGLSVGVGMALAARKDGKKYNTYVVIGDGECNEGMIWEAAMAAGHFGLDNLIVIVDRNGLCVSGPTEQVMRLEPFKAKWLAFNFNVSEVDGHNITALTNTFEEVSFNRNGKPTCVIANTVKGKGVSFMENEKSWHGKHINDEIYEEIMKELG
jgi:transketolase